MMQETAGLTSNNIMTIFGIPSGQSWKQKDIATNDYFILFIDYNYCNYKSLINST
jgi:hypothetical protein